MFIREEPRRSSSLFFYFFRTRGSETPKMKIRISDSPSRQTTDANGQGGEPSAGAIGNQLHSTISAGGTAIPGTGIGKAHEPAAAASERQHSRPRDNSSRPAHFLTKRIFRLQMSINFTNIASGHQKQSLYFSCLMKYTQPTPVYISFNLYFYGLLLKYL